MKRIFSILFCLTSALPAMGAGIFDGSTSDLLITDSATAIEYPVFVRLQYKADNATHRGTLWSMTDNNAGGSLDGIAVEIRGDADGDRINATSWAAGNSSAAATTVRSIATGEFQQVIAIFESASSRRILDDDTSGRVWREQTTTRAAGNWTHLSIGALYNSGATNRFDGNIGQVFVAFGADAAGMIATPDKTLAGNAEWLTIRHGMVLRLGMGRKVFDYADWNTLPEITNNAVTVDYP